MPGVAPVSLILTRRLEGVAKKRAHRPIHPMPQPSPNYLLTVTTVAESYALALHSLYRNYQSVRSSLCVNAHILRS